jgi:glycosyltransferase involved in cell wall biosynthesis
MYWSQNRAYNFVNKVASQGLINLNDLNLIHAHKLTFEGIAGCKLAQKLNIPLVVTLRQTDTTVLYRKPGSVNYFKPVIKNCNRFFYLNPQILIRMKRIFGDSFYNEFIAPKAVFLPNIVDRNISQEECKVDRGVFLTVLRMSKKSVKRKNLQRLLYALKSLDNKNIKLIIIGDGEYKSTIHSWVEKLNLQDQVLFEGAIPNKDIDKYFGTAEAFLLPSLS